MPTFMFFQQSSKKDVMRGADPNALEEKIKKWYGSADDGGDDSPVKGYVRSSVFMLIQLLYTNNL